MSPPRIPMEQRFWEKVDKTGDCWLWTGARDGDGYGALNTPGRPSRKMRAHRYSFLLHFGAIHNSTLVCHKCDTPSCVRPSHLFAGSPRDNTADMVAKGRHGNRSTGFCRKGHSYAEYGRTYSNGVTRCLICIGRPHLITTDGATP